MSTGKRLAKRSIIGTRICAQGLDDLWYSGVIQTVDTPMNMHDNNNCINITPNTKYTVRFDPNQDMSRRGPKREFYESDLIGPGFRTIMDVSLRPGQKIFITYNGRESPGEVIGHDVAKDEVNVLVKPLGHEAPLELKKRLEEVRLLESRRSARLADQDRDTDFARLADMGGDRRRASHSIDVPLTALTTTHNGSRKRRPSYSQDDFYTINDDDPMDECHAALVLMSLSCSPHSPQTARWNTILGTSPGSSNASWSSGSASPPLSDDGKSPNGEGRFRTSSLSTSDEGIVMDYNEEMPRKKRANGPVFKCTWKGCGVIYTTVNQIESHVRKAHLGPKKLRQSIDDDGSFSDSDHEEVFYYTEVEDHELETENSPSPPTLSHRDMARPPHEDPEYQRQIVGTYRQNILSMTQQVLQVNNLSISNANNPQQQSQQQQQQQQATPPPPIAHHNYAWSQQSPNSPQKHVRLSPRPSTSYAPYPSPTYSSAAQNLTNTLLAVTHHNMPQNLSSSLPTHHTLQHHHQQQQQQQQQHHHHQQQQPPPNHQSTLPQQQLHQQPQQHPQQITQHHPHIHHHQQQLHPTHQHHSVIVTPTSPTVIASHSSSAPPSLGCSVASHIINSVPAQQPIIGKSPLSPNRRARGENKKCRKIYGMDNKDMWCTQCKWKKACSRFGD